MGLLNITLDWSNITSVVVTYPYSVQVIIFLTFVLTVSLYNIPCQKVIFSSVPVLDPDSYCLFREPLGIAYL